MRGSGGSSPVRWEEGVGGKGNTGYASLEWMGATTTDNAKCGRRWKASVDRWRVGISRGRKELVIRCLVAVLVMWMSEVLTSSDEGARGWLQE